jgi:hypothetical protein
VFDTCKNNWFVSYRQADVPISKSCQNIINDFVCKWHDKSIYCKAFLCMKLSFSTKSSIMQRKTNIGLLHCSPLFWKIRNWWEVLFQSSHVHFFEQWISDIVSLSCVNICNLLALGSSDVESNGNEYQCGGSFSS